MIGSWALHQIKEAGKNSDSISFMPFPNEVNGKRYMTFNTDYNYGVSRNSENKEAAKAFLFYMLDESGYAIDQDRISIVKTDPYPDIYGDMGNVVLLGCNPYDGGNYNIYQNMCQAINPADASEIRRIVRAAGEGSEDYDAIMQEWNDRWEGARAANAVVWDRSKTLPQATEESSEEVSSTESSDDIYVKDYDIMLSPTEQEYIAQKQTLKVGYLRNRAPFQYESGIEDGQSFEGLSAIMCRTIEENTGLALVYEPYDSEEELIQALERGNLDMAAGIENSPSLEQRVKFSREYIDFANVLIKNENVNTDSLEGSRQAVISGKSNYIKAVEDYKEVEVSTISEAVRSINEHKADFAITNYYSAEYYIRDEECQSVVVIPLTEKSKLSFAYANDVDTRLISISNKCIYSLSEDSIQMMLMQNMDPQVKPVTLKRFVEENPLTAALASALILLLILGAFFKVRDEKEKSRKKHAIDAKRYKILSQLTDEYVFEYDLQENILHFEKKFQEKFNFEENIKLEDYMFNHPALNKLIENCDLAKEKDATTTEAFELEDCSGEKQWYRMIAYRIAGEDAIPKHLIGKIVNIQKTVEEKQRIQEQADKDALTGIYNRTGYEKRFNELFQKHGEDVAVSFAVLDFDNFKAVNDLLGHAGGDEALKLLADKLDKLSGEDVIVARYGGDEFVICMFAVEKEKAQAIYASLVKSMNTDLSYQGQVHHLSISLGAVYSQTLLSTAKLFKEADKVLYGVKAGGKNEYKLADYMDKL